jgi:uncharacterized membrane protein YbhN (UPF0104 family)
MLTATIGHVSWAQAGFLSFLGFAANSVPLTPGGLGVGEVAFDSLFRIASINGAAAAMLSWRILLMALAPAGLALYLRGQRFDVASRVP